MRIQIDFDTVGDAAAVLTATAVAPLAETPASARVALDDALAEVGERWRADPLPGDVAEAGDRLAASAGDLRAAEESAVAELRSIEAALG